MITFFLFALLCHAKLPEKHYQKKWCAEQNGQIEVLISDRQHVDCVTATHAVEVDFAPKWQEAVGQSLMYAFEKDLKPGIVLVVRGPKENKFLIRLKSIIKHFKIPIDVWAVDGEGMSLDRLTPSIMEDL